MREDLHLLLPFSAKFAQRSVARRFSLATVIALRKFISRNRIHGVIMSRATAANGPRSGAVIIACCANNSRPAVPISISFANTRQNSAFLSPRARASPASSSLDSQTFDSREDRYRWLTRAARARSRGDAHHLVEKTRQSLLRLGSQVPFKSAIQKWKGARRITAMSRLISYFVTVDLPRVHARACAPCLL